jgi:hypothetical protein
VAWVYLAVLAVAGWLMISRRLTATLALPLTALTLALLALGSALLSGAPLAAPAAGGGTVPTGLTGALGLLVGEVIEGGLTRLATPIVAVILGAVLAAQLRLSGAAERIVRYAAEYAGEDRFRLGLILLAAAAVLFTTLGGLGAVILVASIMLPLLLSLGFEPKIAAGLMLLALSLGGTLNPVNWQQYVSILKLTTPQIVPYALVLAGIYFAVCVVFLLRHTAHGSRPAQLLGPPLALTAVAAGLTVLVLYFPAGWDSLKHGLAWLLAGLLGLLALLLLVRLARVAAGMRGSAAGDAPAPAPALRPDNWLAAAAILVPLLLLLWASLEANLHGADDALDIPINTALLCGIVFALLASHSADGTSGNRLMRALHEGVTSAAPAVMLLLGIGMLLKATGLLPVRSAFAPLVAALPIKSPPGYVATFTLLSPLALYRGPLNLYGMGSGIMGILSGASLVSSGLLMVAFQAVGQLQGVCDPTNTHNVWIANFCRVPVNDLTRLLFPWVAVIVFAGLVAGAAMFHKGF